MELIHSIIILFVAIIGIHANLSLALVKSPEDGVTIAMTSLPKYSSTQNEPRTWTVTKIDYDKKCQCKENTEPDLREDYVHVSGIGSYKFHNLAKNWNEARKICNEENAHLAIINSKAEEAALMEILKENTGFVRGAVRSDQALIGIHDIFQEGEWVTVLGNSLESTGYSKWSVDKFVGDGVLPDRFRESKSRYQACGSLLVYGGMDDVFCDEKYPFICEVINFKN